MMTEEYHPHPLYEDRDIRAIFRPRDLEGLNDGAKQMVGHEFVWTHIGYSGGMPLWMPADKEDIDAYFEVVDMPRPDLAVLWILEEDLDIMRVEKLDG
jgi:hypothetical protein